MIRGLALAALVLLGAAGPSSPPPLLLREQAWTAPDADLAYALTHGPGECLARRDSPAEIGRALFRSPALLGGPAARVGLSCHACHSNGRVNTHFLLLELSDRAGHADVTSAWASKTRGDGVDNPIAIPDLAGASTRAGFGRAREPSLEIFVRGVIEEEFQGAPPPAQAFDGLIAYLRALNADACPVGDARIDLSAAADDVRRALGAARAADAPSASLALLATQDALGRIAERLPARTFAPERRRLEGLARDIAGLRDVGAGIGPALEAAAPGWLARFDAAISRIARRERSTYFNEAKLRDALSP